jgi:hypothetical protein
MRKMRWLVIPLFLLFAMGCGLISDVQNIQNAASTQLPAILTSAPTAQGMVETLAAQQTSSDCGTPTAGGLGIALDRAKTVLEVTGQFTFTDGTVDGQPASTATLASGGASNFAAIANDFSAQFIGDPCNLSRILVKAPYTDQQETVDEGLAAANILFAAILPVDVQLPLLTWLAENYSNVPEGGTQQTTIKNMQFTLTRSQGEMSLEIVPTN